VRLTEWSVFCALKRGTFQLLEKQTEGVIRLYCENVPVSPRRCQSCYQSELGLDVAHGWPAQMSARAASKGISREILTSCIQLIATDGISISSYL
jgi:hypothetical protein